MILFCDGKTTPLNQVVHIAATDIRQNFYVVGDVDIKIPCHLYAVQQIEQPAASNSGKAHVSGAMVPGSSVDSSSSNMSLHFSLVGGYSQVSTLGKAKGSLLNSYLMSENVE